MRVECAARPGSGRTKDLMSLEERFRLGLEVIRDAGELAHGYFNAREKLSVQTKGPQDLASEADLNTELLIRDRITKAFPEDAFLGEETPPTAYEDGQGIWVVDPIDGTQPFICGMSCWCVSIAFVRNGRLRIRHGQRPGAQRALRRRQVLPLDAQRQAHQGPDDGHDQGRPHRHGLFAEERASHVPARLPALPRSGRHVLPRRLGRLEPVLCGGGPSRRLLRAGHQVMGLPRRHGRRRRRRPSEQRLPGERRLAQGQPSRLRQRQVCAEIEDLIAGSY